MGSDGLNRREFSVLLAGAAATLSGGWSHTNASVIGTASDSETGHGGNEFPEGDYTPFGYPNTDLGRE